MSRGRYWRPRIRKLPLVRHSEPVWLPIWRRVRGLGLLVRMLPGLAADRRQRALFAEIWRFTRQLPGEMKAPIPQAMDQLTPEVPAARPDSEQEDNIRKLADLAILLDRRSPLGLCLRRSMTRYYFLRRAGLPVAIHYGARFDNGQPDRPMTGHAWLTLDGQAYHEAGRNWRGFTIMLSFPQEKQTQPS